MERRKGRASNANAVGFLVNFQKKGASMREQIILIPALLGAMSLAANAGEPAAAQGWKQKQFIITFWCPPPATDEALATVAAEHYNLTWVPVEGLDIAAKHGLRAMLTSDLLSPGVLDDPAKRGQLDALIERVKKHPALEAYYITDEPGAKAFPAWESSSPTCANGTRSTWRTSTCSHLRERGPTGRERRRGGAGQGRLPPELRGRRHQRQDRLAYREHLKQFIEIVKPDLISYDHYHFLRSGDGSQYFLNLALIRQAAQEANRPFLNIVQACNGEKVWRLPNAAEMRWLAYTTMAYGGRGISYFVYWMPRPTAGSIRTASPRRWPRWLPTSTAKWPSWAHRCLNWTRWASTTPLRCPTERKLSRPMHRCRSSARRVCARPLRCARSDNAVHDRQSQLQGARRS